MINLSALITTRFVPRNISVQDHVRLAAARTVLTTMASKDLRDDQWILNLGSKSSVNFNCKAINVDCDFGFSGAG